MSVAKRHRLVVGTRVAIVVAFIAFVELTARAKWIDKLSLVPVTVMVSELADYFRTGEIYPHLTATAIAVLFSATAAAAVGIPIGILLWRVPFIERMLNAYLTSYYAIPTFTFYPLFVVIFGLTVWPLVLIAWGAAVVAIMVNTAYGFREVRPVLRKVSDIYRLGSWKRFWKVEFPAASPYIFNGLRLGVTYALITVVAAEFITSHRGVGYLIKFNYQSFLVAEMYAGILLVLVMAVMLYLLLNLIQRRLGHVR